MGRSDLKTRFSPYVPFWLKEIVIDIGRQRNLSMGETARDIIIEASKHTSVINQLAPFFWRGMERGEFYWPGHLNKKKDISELIDYPYDRSERLTFRMTIEERLLIDDIIVALTVPDAHAVAALLILGVHDKRIVRAIGPMFEPRSRYTIERRAAKWGYLTRR